MNIFRKGSLEIKEYPVEDDGLDVYTVKTERTSYTLIQDDEDENLFFVLNKNGKLGKIKGGQFFKKDSSTFERLRK